MNTPNAEDLLNSIGLTRLDASPATSDWMMPMAMFGAGLVAGVGGALLLAPKSGRELRRDIKDAASNVGETVVAALPEPVVPTRYSHTMPETIEAK